jgi:DNA polymerase
MIECVLDFETASACNLKACGSWRYSEDPTTAVLCLAFKWRVRERGSRPALWTRAIWYPGGGYLELLELVNNPQCMFIAHNTGFEKAVWKNIMVPIYGFPPIPPNQWHDTMAVCAMKVIPQDLENAIRVLRLPIPKDMEGNKLTLGLSRFDRRGNMPVLTHDIQQRVGQYCLTDIDAQADLHDRLGYLPPAEREVWLADQITNERGIRLDLPLVRAMQSIVDQAKIPLTDEFREITGLKEVTQGKKLLAWCHDNGAMIPNLQKDTIARALGKDIDGDEDDSLSDYELDNIQLGIDLPRNVRRALTIRQIAGSASIKKLAKMEACVCDDGRARGLLQYHGTGPGRRAGRLLQPQNFPRGTIDHSKDERAANEQVNATVDALMSGDPELVAAICGEPIEVVVSALRHIMIAANGRVLLSGDYSGIQARTVLAIAGQHDKAAMMAAGQDVYCDMAISIFDREVTKKNVPERQVGKNTVLGAGFGMGPPKFQFKYCPDKPLAFAQAAITAYRKVWAPLVPRFWYGIEDAAVKCVYDRRPVEFRGFTFGLEDMWLYCRLPSGRRIWYFNPQRCDRQAPWDPKELRPGFTFQAMKQGVWTTVASFGGQLTENVVCGIEADLIRCANLKCEANGFPIVMEVHDELVAEPLKADADEQAFKQIMLDIPDWAKDLQIPIAVETWTGDRYRK